MMLDHFDDVMTALLTSKPFRVFTIVLQNGDRLEIDHPRAIVVKRGKAIFLSTVGVPNYFDYDSVSQVISVPVHADSN